MEYPKSCSTVQTRAEIRTQSPDAIGRVRTEPGCYWTCSHSTPEQLRTVSFAAESKQIWTVGRNGRDVSGKRAN
jgi:hypothetical protein